MDALRASGRLVNRESDKDGPAKSAHKHARGSESREERVTAREKFGMAQEKPVPVEDVTEGMDHPDVMETSDIERIYAATKGATDESILRWRGKAFVALWIRTGRYPADKPYEFTPGDASPGSP